MATKLGMPTFATSQPLKTPIAAPMQIGGDQGGDQVLGQVGEHEHQPDATVTAPA